MNHSPVSRVLLSVAAYGGNLHERESVMTERVVDGATYRFVSTRRRE